MAGLRICAALIALATSAQTAPAPLPSQAEAETALLDAHTCHYNNDPDDIGECLFSARAVHVQSMRCAPAPPGESREPRVACRFTGTVDYGGRPRQLRRDCFHFRRLENGWTPDPGVLAAGCEMPD
ncbi:hypothetical protein [Sphingomonas sp.]|uniref:hypothetical protein n=1 Tax=Sphingomonas sp. TaxID=28214 RepID=UPI001B11A146|nr:hypothetical protein [Sphingomonas sp.]MBO9711283.1 hypothetical protein [Sphingomonas sp.]